MKLICINCPRGCELEVEKTDGGVKVEGNHYFSPEQARGGYVDEKSDIYSLGISMFEMITGVLPFQGNNSVSIALMHINDELPDIRQYNPNCTPSLEGIIKKATM